MSWQTEYYKFQSLPVNEQPYKNPFGFKEPTHVYVNFDYVGKWIISKTFPYLRKNRQMVLNKGGKHWYLSLGYRTVYGTNN